MAEQLAYPEALEQLRGAYEREKVQLTSKISSLEVTVSQQTIQIERLKESIETLQPLIKEWFELKGANTEKTEID